MTAPNADSVRVFVTADTEQLDECLRALRLLVSQIGFALDGYLASRPPTQNDRSGATA
jgi:putative N-acetylmannosamine-6-phosphate epimerase